MTTVTKELTSNALVTMARNTLVFRDKELEILKELADECLKNEATTYKLICENEGEKLAGFAIFGKTPLTDFGWDIYWLVVDKDQHGKGIGKKLLASMESAMTELADRAIIRVETSSTDEYLRARLFYRNQGYREAGVLHDFYAQGNDLVIYTKSLKSGR
jgi:ribosomal protein S18 acetylase RimI-like enzyme